MTTEKTKLLGDYYNEAYDRFFIYYEELVNNKDNKSFDVPDNSKQDDFVEAVDNLEQEQEYADAYDISSQYADEDIDIVKLFKEGMSAEEIARKTGREKQYNAYYISHWPHHLHRVATGKLDREKSPQWAAFMDECLKDITADDIKLSWLLDYAKILHLQASVTGYYPSRKKKSNG